MDFGLVVGWARRAFTVVDPMAVTDLTQFPKNYPQMVGGMRLGDLGAGNNFKTC
ncbi:MAG: hypothetical protein ACJAZW_001986 [Maritalea sp.]|jgi:hypothetical protein